MIRIALVLSAVCLVVGAIAGAVLDHKLLMPKPPAPIIVEKPVPVEKIVTVHDTRTVVRLVHVDKVTGDQTITTTTGDNKASDSKATLSPIQIQTTLTPTSLDPVAALTLTQRNWRARLMVDTSAIRGGVAFKDSLSYGLGVDRKLFGNVFVGVQGYTDGRVGLGLGIEF